MIFSVTTETTPIISTAEKMPSKTQTIIGAFISRVGVCDILETTAFAMPENNAVIPSQAETAFSDKNAASHKSLPKLVNH